MDMRKAVFLNVFFIAIILLIFSCKTDSRSDAGQKPNILFIMVDDLGKEWVSCYGGEDISTPNIDKLAESGMRMENVYSMPQCTPTRVTLLTGQYPFRHGWVNHWDVPRWGGGAHFDQNLNPSMGLVMREAGYKTLAAGKWQVSDFRVQPDIMQMNGFDDYCMWTGYEGGNPVSASRYWDPYIHTKEGSRAYPGKFGPDVFCDYIIDFMQKNKEHPMFIYYPMVLTHGPFINTPDEENEEGDDQEKFRAMVRYTDKLTGRLVSALEEMKIRENTIIIWSTDNGSPGNMTGSLNGREVKGGKAKTTETGICAPFIVSCPSRISRGIVSDALIDFTDLLPTFAEIAGVDLPARYTYDGVSFAGLILGKEKDSARKWILSMGGQNNARLTENGVENQYYYRDRVVRNKRYKLYINSSGQAEKLIDLWNDPVEKTNLIDSVHIADIAGNLDQLAGVIPRFPEKDNDPVYKPLPAQPWDVKITAKSQEWKKH